MKDYKKHLKQFNPAACVNMVACMNQLLHKQSAAKSKWHSTSRHSAELTSFKTEFKITTNK